MTPKPPAKRSIGTTISTLAFAGCGLWLLAEAADAPLFKAAMLGICAASCLAAALRSPIARAHASWSARSENRDDPGSARDAS